MIFGRCILYNEVIRHSCKISKIAYSLLRYTRCTARTTHRHSRSSQHRKRRYTRKGKIANENVGIAWNLQRLKDYDLPIDVEFLFKAPGKLQDKTNERTYSIAQRIQAELGH